MELKRMQIRVYELEVTRGAKSTDKSGSSSAVLSLRADGKVVQEDMVNSLMEMDGVIFVEEL